MPITMLADMKWDADVWASYAAELDPNPYAFINAGILRSDPILNQLLSSPLSQSNTIVFPSFKPLSGDAENYDGEDIGIDNIESQTLQAVVIGRTKAWGAQDLAKELTSGDPMRQISVSSNLYWISQRQSDLLATLNGVFAATSMSSHIKSYAVDDPANITDANLISPKNIIDSVTAVFGDNAKKIVAMSVHSVVFARLQNLNLITFRPYGEQGLSVPKFLDYTVIVDDQMPVTVSGQGALKYTTYFYAAQSIAVAEAYVEVPAEMARNAREKGGNTELVNRKRFVYHPYGTSFTKASMAKISPTRAELAMGANWSKVYQDKNIPISALITNG